MKTSYCVSGYRFFWGGIGLERQLTGHVAGIRINVLISVGTCFFRLFPLMSESGEAFRIASYIISGVGFLYSGVIFKDSVRVRGINTEGHPVVHGRHRYSLQHRKVPVRRICGCGPYRFQSASPSAARSGQAVDGKRGQRMAVPHFRHLRRVGRRRDTFTDPQQQHVPFFFCVTWKVRTSTEKRWRFMLIPFHWENPKILFRRRWSGMFWNAPP